MKSRSRVHRDPGAMTGSACPFDDGNHGRDLDRIDWLSPIPAWSAGVAREGARGDFDDSL